MMLEKINATKRGEKEPQQPDIKRKMKVKGKEKLARSKHRDIGVEVTPPDGQCDDDKCPFHGRLSVRGQIIEGVVISDKMMRTVVVKKDYMKYVPKYERYERRTGKYLAHNPPCINAKIGDDVRIMECRPLSKTKSFVVIERTR